MEDSADSTGGRDDLETSVNDDLSLNDLSSSITPLSLIKSIMVRSPGNIFERLRPGKFGPKGMYTHIFT